MGVHLKYITNACILYTNWWTQTDSYIAVPLLRPAFGHTQWSCNRWILITRFIYCEQIYLELKWVVLISSGLYIEWSLYRVVFKSSGLYIEWSLYRVVFIEEPCCIINVHIQRTHIPLTTPTTQVQFWNVWKTMRFNQC
mgnify:CR=1 FL=1